MRNNLLKVVRMQILFIMLIFLNACTFTHTITKDFEIPVQNIDKIPMRIGLYLQPDFCRFVFKKDRLGDKYVFQIGEAFWIGTERMLKIAFNDVVILESIESDVSQQRIKAIVIPEIVSVSAIFPAMAHQNVEALITIKYTFTDLNKEAIWIDTFQGKHRRKLGTAFTYHENMRKCMQFAVEDHFRKALEGILASKWWESRAVRREK